MKKLLAALGLALLCAGVSSADPTTIVQDASGAQKARSRVLIFPTGSVSNSSGTHTITFTASTTTLSSSVQGTSTNNNATTGWLGEYVESVVGTTAFPATGTWGDLTTISLTAGDWDITAVLNTEKQSGTITTMDVGVSTVTGNNGVTLVTGSNFFTIPTPTASTDMGFTMPSFRQSLGASTPIYFKFRTSSTATLPNAKGARLSARRVR